MVFNIPQQQHKIVSGIALVCRNSLPTAHPIAERRSASVQLQCFAGGMRCQALRAEQMNTSQLKRVGVSSCRGCSMRAAPSRAVEASKEFDAKALLRPHLLELAPYTPIEPFEVR